MGRILALACLFLEAEMEIEGQRTGKGATVVLIKKKKSWCLSAVKSQCGRSKMEARLVSRYICGEIGKCPSSAQGEG